MGIQLPTRRLVSQSDAAIIEDATIPRAKFIGSWTRKMTFAPTQLVPFMVDECYPGDHMSYNITAYVRMATPLFPVFDNQRIDTFIFYVPSRILWTNWKKMMGEQLSPGDSIAYTVPYVQTTAGGDAVGSLVDHMNVPVLGQVAGADFFRINALIFRAYNRIFNDFFQDENVGIATAINTGDGPDSIGDYVIRNRAKSHDYFTKALPWPQKFTSPTLFPAALAPIRGLGLDTNNRTVAQTNGNAIETGGGAAFYPFFGTSPTQGNWWFKATAATGASPEIYADLAAATGITINAFRQSMLVQQLLERDARGGTRYVEIIRSHFKVNSPDYRLQRAEYIGGGQTPLTITPIAQTAPTAGVPLGAIGGAGTAAGSHRASYAATEHGYIIGLINIRQELSYQQGLHKMFTRSTRYDFYWPSLAQLGEQAILTKELYAKGDNTATDATVFGYQARWEELRQRMSEVTGVFRSTAAGTLDAWHLAEKFTAAPTLNNSFITSPQALLQRVLAAGILAAGQEFLADILINRTATRPIPTHGTPALLGRF